MALARRVRTTYRGAYCSRNGYFVVVGKEIFLYLGLFFGLGGNAGFALPKSRNAVSLCTSDAFLRSSTMQLFLARVMALYRSLRFFSSLPVTPYGQTTNTFSNSRFLAP